MLNELNKIHVSGRFSRTHPEPKQRIFFAELAIKRFNIADTSKDRQERFNELVKMGAITR